MKTSILFLYTCLIAFAVQAQHTFSIVAVDPETGEIGSAGATCIDAEDGALAISDIVLGVGAIHTQSFYLAANQDLARERMEAGDSPQEIIDFLIANDVNGDPSQRQYGVVDLNDGSPRSAAFTGANCFAEFIDVTGPNYAIQGNILISEEVVTDMETAFLSTEGTLAEKLMAALQGAKRPGADSRCLNFGISSASAFIRVADPTDTDSSYGNLSLDLNVWLNGDLFEPIDELQNQFDNLLEVGDETENLEKITITPNPARDHIKIQTAGISINGFEILDINGKVIVQNKSSVPQNVVLIDIAAQPSGVYFINLFSDTSRLSTHKFIKQ